MEPSADRTPLDAHESLEAQHMKKLTQAQLNTEKSNIETELDSLNRTCQQYRITVDRYEKEIQDREEVSNLLITEHSLAMLAFLHQ